MCMLGMTSTGLHAARMWGPGNYMHHRHRLELMLFRWEGDTEKVPALAYILGDEASGSWFSKRLWPYTSTNWIQT